MKDDLSKNRDFKMNWSGFDVFMEYWVDLGINIWKNGRKTHILGIFEGPVLVHLGPVPVQPSRTEPVPVQVRYTLLYFVQCLYFSNNLLISYSISVIQVDN